MKSRDMAPLTAWLPAHSNQDFDLVVRIVGPDASVLLKEWPPIAQLLIDRGFAVMAQRAGLDGDHGDFFLHLRIAAQPFYSMGQGCDVLLLLGDRVPEFRHFNLQPGSVLLWEPPTDPRLCPNLPEGVIPYSIPFAALGAHDAEGLPGRGLAALGALLQLLGLPEESLRDLIPLVTAPRSFAAGWDFAHRALKKRDAFSLPLSWTADTPSRVLLTPNQAIRAGFAVGSCECGTACEGELVRSPAEWITRHTGMTDTMVSVIENNKYPGVQAYRDAQGKVVALLRGNESAMTSCLNDFQAPRAFVAADVPDAMRLLITGHDLIRGGLSDGVGVLIEETVALRHQSIEVRSLVDMVRRSNGIVPDAAARGQSDSAGVMVERDGDLDAHVGFVAWGSAQGVVRDAVALCRSFGIKISGLYPKVIVPFPQEELESFAKTVAHVVLVESNPTHGYEKRLRAACSFQFSVLAPSPGTSLTPMDIFLREGLGAV